MAAGYLSKAVAASAGIAAIIAEVFSVDAGGVKIGFGLADALIEGLVLMVVFLFISIVIHWPLRWAGGTGSFKNTFVANTFVSATAYPLVVLIVGLSTMFGIAEADAWRAAQGPTLGIALLVLAPTHEISWLRAFLVLIVIFPIAMIAVAIAALILLGMLA